MAKRISALNAAASITGTELIPIVIGGVTKTATPSQIAALAAGASGSGDINSAISQVNGIKGQTVAAAATVKGDQLSYNGTQLIQARRAVHIRQFLNSAPNADFAGGGTDFAAAIESAIEFLDSSAKTKGCRIEFDSIVGSTGYRLSRTVNIRRGCHLVGQFGGMTHGSTVFVCDPGVTAFRILGAGDAEAPEGAHDVTISDVLIKSAGQLATTSTCDYVAESFTVALTSGAGDWINGQMVAIDGVGEQVEIAGVIMRVDVANASPFVKIVYKGDQNPTFRVGQYLVVPTAFTAPTRITHINLGAWTANTVMTVGSIVAKVASNGHLYGATSIGSSPNQTGAVEPTWPTNGTSVVDGDITWLDLGICDYAVTMASNSAGVASEALAKFCTPLVTRIVSGAGTTTLTIDSYAGAVSKTGATMRHYDCGVDVLNKCRLHRVAVGDAYSEGHHFPGAAFAVRGDHANEPSSQGVNAASIWECESYANNHALFVVGSDSNNCLFHVQAHQSRDWSFVDLSHLGNGFFSSHADGSQGWLTKGVSGHKFVGTSIYQEGGTWSAFNAAAVFSGTMPIQAGGLNLSRMSELITAPRLGVSLSGNVTYTAVSPEYFAEALEFIGALGANATLTFPYTPAFKPKWIYNKTTGGYNVIIVTSIGGSVIIPPGYGCFVQSDSTNIRRCSPLVRIENSTEHLIAETYQLSTTWNGTRKRARQSTASTTTAAANQVIEDGLYGTDGAQDFTLQDTAVTRVDMFILVKKAGAAEGGSIEVKADYARSGAGPVIIGSATITYNLLGTTLDGTTVDLNINSNKIELRASPESADTLSWTIERTHRDVVLA